jgi:hypothetical protein
MPTAASIRKPVQVSGGGAPTCRIYSAGTNKPIRLVFSQNVAFYRGETLVIRNPNSGALFSWYTVDSGLGTEWLGLSTNLAASPDSGSFNFFYRTDPSSTMRDVGSVLYSGTEINCIVAGATYYYYQAPSRDGASLSNVHVYVDTVKPINSRHPYTRDPWNGGLWYARQTAAEFIPSTADRIAAIDGQLPRLTS